MDAGVSSQVRPAGQLQSLHKTTGHDPLAAFAAAPQHIGMFELQSVRPGGSGGQCERVS